MIVPVSAGGHWNGAAVVGRWTAVEERRRFHPLTGFCIRVSGSLKDPKPEVFRWTASSIVEVTEFIQRSLELPGHPTELPIASLSEELETLRRIANHENKTVEEPEICRWRIVGMYGISPLPFFDCCDRPPLPERSGFVNIDSLTEMKKGEGTWTPVWALPEVRALECKEKMWTSCYS